MKTKTERPSPQPTALPTNSSLQNHPCCVRAFIQSCGMCGKISSAIVYLVVSAFYWPLYPYYSTHCKWPRALFWIVENGAIWLLPLRWIWNTCSWRWNVPPHGAPPWVEVIGLGVIFPFMVSLTYGGCGCSWWWMIFCYCYCYWYCYCYYGTTTTRFIFEKK